ncbi:MAG: hypothetical protein AAFX06_18325, partial [Planctomycetota bacterium]
TQSPDALLRTSRETETINTRVHQLITLYDSVFTEGKLNGPLVKQLYESLEAIVFPESRRPVIYPHRLSSRNALDRTKISAYRLLVRAAMQCDKTDALRDELESRAKTGINTEAIFEALIELAAETNDEQLLLKSLQGFAVAMDGLLPELQSERPTFSQLERSLSKVPPDVLRKARLIDQMTRTLLPLVSEPMGEDAMKIVRPLMRRTGHLIASDPYTLSTHQTLLETIENQ